MSELIDSFLGDRVPDCDLPIELTRHLLVRPEMYLGINHTFRDVEMFMRGACFGKQWFGYFESYLIGKYNAEPKCRIYEMLGKYFANDKEMIQQLRIDIEEFLELERKAYMQRQCTMF